MRTMPREFYIPKNGKLVPHQIAPEKAAIYLDRFEPERTMFVAFLGKQSKPFKTVVCRTYEIALNHAQELYNRIAENLASRQREREESRKRKAEEKDAFEGIPGSIFVASWGYEQTNVDAYQMVRRISKTKIEAIEIGFEQVQCVSSMAEDVKPVQISPEEIEKREKIIMTITGKKSVRKQNAHSFLEADLWDGKRKYYHSSYA